MFLLLPIVMPIVLFIVTLTMLFLYLSVISSKHNNSSSSRQGDSSHTSPLPPGSLGLPVIGETLALIFQGEKFYESRLKRYGNIYKTHVLGCPVIRVIGAEHVKTILMNENNLVTVYWPTSVRKMLGDGTVANAIGELHRIRRRALQKAFSRDALSDYVSVMQKVVRRFIQSWCSQEMVNGYPECKNMTFALVAEALVGFDLTPEEHSSLLEVFSVFEENLFSLPIYFPVLGFAKGMAARKVLLHKIEHCLQKKRNEGHGCLEDSPEVDVQTCKDAMTRLLEVTGEDSLNMPELKELCLELLFAGHSTTASAATSILMYLQQHSHVITKLEAELEEHGLAQVEEGDLSPTSLGNLKYTSAVVKEVLRMAPPVGAGFRKVIKPFSLNGYQMPVGWTLVYSIRETQETTDVFPEARTFNPDRWMHQSCEDEKFHYLPFGGGPRICVGKEFAKLFLHVFIVEIIRSCTWQLVNGSIRMKYLPVPHPVDGLPVRFSDAPLSERIL